MSRPDGLPPADTRPWIKLHVGMPDQPAVVTLSDSAFRLLVEATCYSGREQTDGHVPRAMLDRLASKRTAVPELVDAGHLERVDDRTWRLVDYLTWNQSATEIAVRRSAKASAGSLGNHQRWHTGDKRRPDPDCDHCYPPLRQVNQ